MAVLEVQPYRPFKSCETYLQAMKEDLAEWFNILYPDLKINSENFMNQLDNGIFLCTHANNVREAAKDYIKRRQLRRQSLTRSISTNSGLIADAISSSEMVQYFDNAQRGTFFARDNVANFIGWCRKTLKVKDCILFESDDLILRKNEKHVILCLLEVARRGAKFGILAPMLIKMERQIDRELAADKRNRIAESEIGVTISSDPTPEGNTESEEDSSSDESVLLVYNQKSQTINNDLKSLDELVRELVEECNCPTQFPIFRISEGKYRVGNSGVKIFVRILRYHIMVRVGGGWDTMSNFLNKHDPCRCKAKQRSTAILQTPFHNGNGIELHNAQVIFNRTNGNSVKKDGLAPFPPSKTSEEKKTTSANNFDGQAKARPRQMSLIPVRKVAMA